MERTGAFRATLATLLATVEVMAVVATSQKSATTKLFDISRNTKAWRILGGANATEHEFLTQVYISSSFHGSKFIFFCGGTIISETWILTAAHCVNNSKKTNVGFGSSYMNNLKFIAAERVIPHEKYRIYGRHNNNADNDMGLVQLSKPIDLNGYTAAAARLPQSRHYHPTKNGVVVGWGRWTYKSEQSGGESPVLKKLDVHVFTCPYYCCSVICTKAETGTGICDGDSGGPLLIDGVVHGVASYVDNLNQDPNLDPNQLCPDADTWAVYTSVAAFREWIQKHSGI